MKVSIIGGGGLVGSCAAYALQCGGLANEIALLDVNEELAVGHALDLQHGSPSVANQKFAGGGYEHIPTSDVICITAGLRRKPDESRLDLINRNTDLFMQILRDVKAAGPKPSAIVLVVSNPVDILTYVAAQTLDLPVGQVIGLGTQLDTIRFCSLIAAQLNAPPAQTKALILGEHGESMVPIWSSATIAGLPLEKYPDWTPSLSGELFKRTRGSGAEVISRKGGAGFAVGIAIRDCIDAIILDNDVVLPISSVQNGCYGVRDVALSVPTVLGRTGVQATMEIDLWPKEVQGIRASGTALRKTLDTVLQRIG
ncbi:lactate/malate dehydrogenase family protein [Rhodopirellula sallentina]|uniref:L-lactate dehydrogenase n=1 Tax=Rhodopirellula sallentina SM41 TaxID=1263870 RepID=M5U1V1_9BACT|nr:lactate/malate dehydrogenase family protein [Rhodopirellula sallentina]EMI55415.1 L-lactate dehydrogenase [Rhodopirellula sallentina SM41]